MREHTLANTGGLTYADMGQYQSADHPSDAAGTNDPEAAAKDENGNPISNSARNMGDGNGSGDRLDMGSCPRCSRSSACRWVALLLTGIGLVILAVAVFGRLWPVAQSVAPSPVPEPAAA
jgi:hypothetical protein